MFWWGKKGHESLNPVTNRWHQIFTLIFVFKSVFHVFQRLSIIILVFFVPLSHILYLVPSERGQVRLSTKSFNSILRWLGVTQGRVIAGIFPSPSSVPREGGAKTVLFPTVFSLSRRHIKYQEIKQYFSSFRQLKQLLSGEMDSWDWTMNHSDYSGGWWWNGQ